MSRPGRIRCPWHGQVVENGASVYVLHGRLGGQKPATGGQLQVEAFLGNVIFSGMMDAKK